MNECELMKLADDRLRDLDREINSYPAVANAATSINQLREIISFYRKRREDWTKMLAGASDIARRTLLHFIQCAGLEIEIAELRLRPMRGKYGR